MTKRVLITGASGFLGKHLFRYLRQMEPDTICVRTSLHDPDYPLDLTDRTAVVNFFKHHHIPFDVVYHLAGDNGGINYNLAYPASILANNTAMIMNLLRACVLYQAGKVISVVASCAYPSSHPICREKYFLRGMPHPSVQGHAWAKRNVQLATTLFSLQYGLKAVCLCPTTLYGPGMAFDEKAKVMGGMIRTIVEAKRNRLPCVQIMGTGNPLRDFLYVDDCVQLIHQAGQVYDNGNYPLNLGSQQEISIAELAYLIADLAGYTGKIEFDPSRPDGQMRKLLNTNRLRRLLPSIRITPLDEGIYRSIAWYEEHYPCAKTA